LMILILSLFAITQINFICCEGISQYCEGKTTPVCVFGDPSKDTREMPINLTIAFIADNGLGKGFGGDRNDSINVLNMVKFEAELAIFSGDSDYQNSPTKFQQQWDTILGDSYPVISSIGNHDEDQWNGYQNAMYTRYIKSGLSNYCYGEVGKDTICSYKGLSIVSSGQGTPLITQAHINFVNLSFSTYPQFVWRICSFHKNQKLFQIGLKRDEVGYQMYDACREKGAIITTGHEHSYSRTKTMTNYATQSYIDKLDKNQIQLSEGTNVAWVSGVSGQQIRESLLRLRRNPWWASTIAADTTPALKYGCVFCKFNYNGNSSLAYCYFKQTDGKIRDEFYVYNALNGPTLVAPGFDTTPYMSSYDILTKSIIGILIFASVFIFVAILIVTYRMKVSSSREERMALI